MMLINSVKVGFNKGIETTWMLAKVIIPVYFVLTFLQHTPAIDWFAQVFRPVMALFNLPGEAAIILVLGNALNLYAAVGAISAIQLTPLEVTTIGIMLSFSHSLLMEAAVTKKLGVSVTKVILIRLALAVGSGIIVGRIGGLL